MLGKKICLIWIFIFSLSTGAQKCTRPARFWTTLYWYCALYSSNCTKKHTWTNSLKHNGKDFRKVFLRHSRYSLWLWRHNLTFTLTMKMVFYFILRPLYENYCLFLCFSFFVWIIKSIEIVAREKITRKWNLK